MKSGHVALLALLVFSALGTVPGVQAAATTIPGLQAIVLEDGTSADVELKWRVSVDDPDQVDGSLLYNVTIESGSGWVNLGDASAFTGYTTGDGFQRVVVQFSGATATHTFNVTVDDGTGPVDSCTVAIDTAIDGDFDLCGELDFTWSQIHCLGRTGDDFTGFDTEARIIFSPEDNELFFDYAPGAVAHGGKALGGDTGSYEFEFTLRAGVDGARSRVVGAFSSVDTPVVKGGGGNFQTTGAFRDGVSFRLTESGSEWDLDLYEHVDGTRTSLLSETLTTVDPNTATAGKFTVNQYAGIVTFTLGTESFAFSESAMTTSLPTNLHSFWLGADAVTFLAGPNTYFSRDSTSLCFNTLATEFGGGSADFIAQGQPIENFPGAGGTGGDPMFPGIDVQSFSDALGVDDSFMAYALTGILFLGLSILGFFIAGPVGVGLGGIAATVLSATFNLVPYWAIVVAFLLSVTVVIMGGRR